MAVVTIKKAAKLVGKSSQTLYRHTKNGKLSKTGSGYDTAELIRVYGALRNITDDTTNESEFQPIDKRKFYENARKAQSSGWNTDTSAEIGFLKKENEMLRKQLEKTEKRLDKEEERCDRMWQTIENRLPAPSAVTTIMGKLKTKLFD